MLDLSRASSPFGRIIKTLGPPGAVNTEMTAIVSDYGLPEKFPDVVEKFSELIATPGLRVFDSYGTNVLNELRDGEFLEDYGRDFTFEDFLCETISENFYEFDFIESSVEKYDHKRGFCTLSTEVQVSVEDLMNNTPFLNGWRASVETAQGTLMFDT